MNIRYWFWRAFKPNRARGIKAAITRKDNEARKRMNSFIVQPPSQVPPQAGVINNEAAS